MIFYSNLAKSLLISDYLEGSINFQVIGYLIDIETCYKGLLINANRPSSRTYRGWGHTSQPPATFYPNISSTRDL
jgi:hypothetical protein